MRKELSAEYDRCGWGTPWGCKQTIELGQDVGLVMNACSPQDFIDNGHRLFHMACMPASAVPGAGRRTLSDELIPAWRRDRVGRTAAL